MGIDVTMSWDDGLDERVVLASLQGLNAAGEVLLGSSKELSPVDTGDNRNSASTQEATRADPTVWVIFNMPYSALIHEGVGMTFNVSKNPQAQAKYLETPLIRDRQILLQIVAAPIRRAMS